MFLISLLFCIIYGNNVEPRDNDDKFIDLVYMGRDFNETFEEPNVFRYFILDTTLNPNEYFTLSGFTCFGRINRIYAIKCLGKYSCNPRKNPKLKPRKLFNNYSYSFDTSDFHSDSSTKVKNRILKGQAPVNILCDDMFCETGVVYIFAISIDYDSSIKLSDDEVHTIHFKMKIITNGEIYSESQPDMKKHPKYFINEQSLDLEYDPEHHEIQWTPFSVCTSFKQYLSLTAKNDKFCNKSHVIKTGVYYRVIHGSLDTSNPNNFSDFSTLNIATHEFCKPYFDEKNIRIRKSTIWTKQTFIDVTQHLSSHKMSTHYFVTIEGNVYNQHNYIRFLGDEIKIHSTAVNSVSKTINIFRENFLFDSYTFSGFELMDISIDKDYNILENEEGLKMFSYLGSFSMGLSVAVCSCLISLIGITVYYICKKDIFQL